MPDSSKTKKSKTLNRIKRKGGRKTKKNKRMVGG